MTHTLILTSTKQVATITLQCSCGKFTKTYPTSPSVGDVMKDYHAHLSSAT